MYNKENITKGFINNKEYELNKRKLEKVNAPISPTIRYNKSAVLMNCTSHLFIYLFIIIERHLYGR